MNEQSGKVRVAIIGVGSCASSLVQGVEYYKGASKDDFVPGLMHVDLGGYHIKDIEFTATYPRRSSSSRTTPISSPTCRASTSRCSAARRTTDSASTCRRSSPRHPARPPTSSRSCAIPRPMWSSTTYRSAARWRQSGTSSRCSKPAVPSSTASRSSSPAKTTGRRFRDRGLPIIGDDIKSQVCATITHRVLTPLFADRGVRIDRTYQLHFGGNTDFLNMLERERLESKNISKTNAVTSQIDYHVAPEDVHVGPSDYVPWLKDRKWCHIRIEGTTFGDVPLNMELKLEVWDSPNSAGVVIDAIRCAKLALDNNISGALLGPSTYFMKSPPIHYHDEAREMVEALIRETAAQRQFAEIPADDD